MGEVYKMTIAGCERELPICPISDTLDIAGFVMFGDVEITEKTAKALMEKCPEHDIIITAESKGIPLAYEMARIGCRQYVVARKGIKAYMTNPIKVEVKSITIITEPFHMARSLQLAKMLCPKFLAIHGYTEKMEEQWEGERALFEKEKAMLLWAYQTLGKDIDIAL